MSYDHMKNRQMARKLAAGDAVSVSTFRVPGQDIYRIPPSAWAEDVDWCDGQTEEWIWSIGRNDETREIFAAKDARYYNAEGWTCLWLR